MPTTEIVTIPLVPGSEIGNPDNQAAGVHKEVSTIVSQQDGFHNLHFGTLLENPGTIQWLIDWESKPKHEEFMTTSTYQTFLGKFKTIIGGPFSMMHVDFSPPGGIDSARGAPVTETAVFYYDGAPPADAVESATKFMEGCEKELMGGAKIRWAYGITHEVLEKDGVKGKAAVLLVGWESKEEHMRVRGTEWFKENALKLKNDAKAVEMHHVQLMKFVE